MAGKEEGYDPEVYYEQGMADWKAGALDAARDGFMKAFHYGKDPKAAGVLLELSKAFNRSALWGQAEKSLLAALRIRPDDGEARRLLEELHEKPERLHAIQPFHDEVEAIRKKAECVLTDVPAVQLFIELTNQCNGKCITCLNRSMRRERGIMDFRLFRKIVDGSLEHLHLEMVHFYSAGESYLVPDVLDYLDYALPRYAKRGIRTCLITNGERVTSLPGGLSVVDISFNGGRKETYERITGLDFERTLANIWRLQREGALDARTSVRMLVFEDNREEIEDFKKLFAYTCAELAFSYKYDNQCGEIKDRTVAGHRASARIPCHYVRGVIDVAWNGDVILCPHDFEGSVRYGNAREQSLRDIWYGERHRGMLNAHAACRFEGLCARCNFNLPIEGRVVTVPRAERIALRKQHADFAWQEMIRCPHREGCEIVPRYLEHIDELEGGEEDLISACASDYRFYGADALANPSLYPYCPELKKLRFRIERTRSSWEAPVFGPSGYAFAARGHLLGLKGLGSQVHARPIWGDCKVALDGEGDGDG